MSEQIIYNFSPGPAMLPKTVLQEAASDIINWKDLGFGILEVSHRSQSFASCYTETIQNLRDLMNIPSDYVVLFLHGGAIGQNAAVPMNLIQLSKKKKADFLITGVWSEKSSEETKKYGKVCIVATSKESNFTTIPKQETWSCNKDTAYLQICTNETISGVEFQNIPCIKNTLVADVSSNILSRVWDIKKFGVLFSCAQKNIGTPGLSIVIIRKNLLGYAMPITPLIWNWTAQAENDSMLNTPPIFSIYLANAILKWLKKNGGISAFEEINIKKSEMLYNCIDNSSLYYSLVEPKYRSRMNVVFYLKDESLNESFIKEAEKIGLLNLKGHKTAGGMRASIYNAMPIEGVNALVNYMKKFEHCV